MELLGYSDLRAVRKWCEQNNVLIIKQGKCEFVIEVNFNEAYEKPFINTLKKKFGDEWETVYRLYKDGNIPALNTLKEIKKPRIESTFTSSGQTGGEVYKKYLKEFEGNGKTKAA